LIFGSGAPLCYVESALNALKTSMISTEDKELILHRNLEQLLHGR
jgi:predicted TIM-barrel fold metal-dependent hydrolase